MSCNCGSNNQQLPNHCSAQYSCNHVNHMFDPNPPAFYGTWNRLYGYETPDGISSTQCGIATGLYRQNGPLQCRCCSDNITMLTGVNTNAKIVLTVTFNYTNSGCNYSVDLTPGTIYTIKYLEDGTIKQCTGMLSNIYKVNTLNEDQAIYKLRFDCSSNYSHNVVVIKSDQIRDVKPFVKYQEEEIKINSAIHSFGTTIGKYIKNVVINNATLDSNKNIISGNIIQGELVEGVTINGIVQGQNSNGHYITVINAQTSGGNITEGIVNGGLVVGQSEITGGTIDAESGIVRDATVKGDIDNAMISSTVVDKAYTTNTEAAVVIDPTIYNGQLIDPIVSGPNMITKGGVTVGDITTGGITFGGTATGGAALGYINNDLYTIIGGTTTTSGSPISSEQLKQLLNTVGASRINTEGILVTNGGAVTGGTVIGGTKVGNAIYGAIIQGGVNTGGIARGGITSKGILIPGIADDILNSANFKGALYDPSWSKYIRGLTEAAHEHNFYGHYCKVNNLLLMTDKATHSQLYTNLATTTMGTIPH